MLGHVYTYWNTLNTYPYFLGHPVWGIPNAAVIELAASFSAANSIQCF